jgi:hypothetical protein
VAHIGSGSAQVLTDLGVDARAAGLALLARHLGLAAALVEDLEQHSDLVSEGQVVSALARIWALSVALDQAGPDRWEALKGQVRRSFVESGQPLRLEPLGAAWWENASGARGITLYAWDEAASELRVAVSARPAGADLRFARSADSTAFWGVRLGQLLAGPFEIHNPRLAADGTLSPTGRAGASEKAGGWRGERLDGIGRAIGAGLSAAGLTGQSWPVKLVAVRDAGRAEIDGPNQRLVWTLEEAGGGAAVVLAQPIAPDSERRVDHVLALAAARARITHVLARRLETHWEPVSVFEQRKGALRLRSLDFAEPPKESRGAAARRALGLMSRRLSARPPAPPTRPLAARVCDDVRELVEELAATGRTTLSSGQRTRRDRAARQCDQLALGTLARAVAGIGDRPSPEALMRAQHLADRVATLCSEQIS